MICMFPHVSPPPPAEATTSAAESGDGSESRGATCKDTSKPAAPPHACSGTPWLQTQVYNDASHCIHRSQRKKYVADLKLVINAAAAGRSWTAQVAFEQGLRDHSAHSKAVKKN